MVIFLFYQIICIKNYSLFRSQRFFFLIFYVNGAMLGIDNGGPAITEMVQQCRLDGDLSYVEKFLNNRDAK